MTRAEAAMRIRAEDLAAASDLFEAGALSDAPDTESYIRRLNTMVARYFTDVTQGLPAGMADAITRNGSLKTQAALIVLGRWLLIDGQPGMKKQGGRQADPKVVLQCVAAIMVEIRRRKMAEANSNQLATTGRESRKREITKHDLSKRWEKLFGEKLPPSTFDARLRSVARILPAYLDQIKSGRAFHGTRTIKSSPEVTKVLETIRAMPRKSQKGSRGIWTEPDVQVPARLAPFEIAPTYQSDLHEEEYRRQPKHALPAARLRYRPLETTPTAASGIMREDRKGKVVLQPEVDIRSDYKTTALIDRMVILVETRKSTSWQWLRGQIARHTGISLNVRDLRDKREPEDGWGAPFMDIDPAKLSGSPFAIMIQDPTPASVKDILAAIAKSPGIIGPVLLHLIEVSVDFHPKGAASPEEAILRRERMVGLLQRHHWVRPSLIVDPKDQNPRYSDPRQIHDDEDKLPERKPKTRYLFSHGGSEQKAHKVDSDTNLCEQHIRHRVLRTKAPNDLYLNSTLVKGGKRNAFHISIQHKIADRRDRDNNTATDLPDNERRARVEVTISGTETLRDRGLTSLDDLGRVSFRNLTKNLLGFKLATIEPKQHLLDDATTQMKTRGVYGVDLRLRALELEKREALKKTGKKLPRDTDREGMALDDWREMNDVIGKALDELTRRWRGFTSG